MNAPIRHRQLDKAISHFNAMNAAYGDMLDNGLHGGPAYDTARDRFLALKESVRGSQSNRNQGEER